MKVDVKTSNKFGPIEKQTKQVLFNVFKYFEAQVAKDMSCVTTAAQLTANATGLSLGTVHRIVAEGRRSTNQDCIEFSAPKKTRNRASPTALDDKGKGAIRKIIGDYKRAHNEFPTLKVIQQKLKATIEYNASISTLRKQIISLGFNLKHTKPSEIVKITRNS